MNPETIQNNYNHLIGLGIPPKKIATYTQLLGNDPETIQDHYNHLISLGIPPKKINSQAGLLARDPNTLFRNYKYLTDVLKLEEKKVQS